MLILRLKRKIVYKAKVLKCVFIEFQMKVKVIEKKNNITMNYLHSRVSSFIILYLNCF